MSSLRPPTPGDADTRRDTRRRFEQWARNPQCRANTISAILGVKMVDVVNREGRAGTFGQSPFALARGQVFEAVLLRDGARRLIDALIEAEVVPPGSTGLADLRLRQHGGQMKNLDAAIGRTRDLLIEFASNPTARESRPCLLAGAAVRVPGELMLPEAVLVMDALVVRHDESPPRLLVGEVKTYPDRDGHTDPEQLATARAQAGAYAHGLQLSLQELGIVGRLQVSERGFLVLTRPGSNMPSVRGNEDLRYQIERARRGFEHLRVIARSLSAPPASDPVEMVRESSTTYVDGCVAFCERASICRDRAFERGDPSALGQEMSRWLGEVSLTRALDLLSGTTPANAAEEDFVVRFRELGTPA